MRFIVRVYYYQRLSFKDDGDPFGGKIKGNHIFGRGACDDKGELITRIKAVEYILKEGGGGLPACFKIYPISLNDICASFAISLIVLHSL
jgi:hypothetical protein